MSTTCERFIEWAETEPSITMVTLIGSRSRPADAPDGPTATSDWDFQIATTDPAMYDRTDWLKAINGQPIAYVKRLGATGVVDKVTAVFPDGDVEWVIIPAEAFAGFVQAAEAGVDSAHPMVQKMFAEMGKVLFGNYRILKGGEPAEAVYEAASRLGADAFRRNDDQVIATAEGFVCDYISLRRKINRGELRASQLLLNEELLDELYWLLFELRKREGLHAKPMARRLEELGDPRLPLLDITPSLDHQSLTAAADKAAGALRVLVGELVGTQWAWPDLSGVDLAE